MKSKKRLRIGVDARSLLCREPRGEGKSLLRLYREILLQRPDSKVVFFGDYAASNFRGNLPDGISVTAIDLPGDRFSAWENLYFPAAATLAGCNVLHCTSSGGPRWSWQPQVLTVHDLIPILFDDGLSENARALFKRRLNNGVRQARRIITVSAHTKKDLLQIFPALKTPVEVIHWGSDGPLANSNGGPAPGTAYLLLFGGEARRKNTAFAIERFFNIATSLPALKLFVVGVSNQQQRQALIDMATQRDLADRLMLPGFISEGELDDLIRNATALLYLSLYEGFGLPVLEAIERGVPVIASDRTSIPEVLEGVPGCFSLEDPLAIEQAIIDLAEDPEERKRWQSRQSAVLARFDWTKTAAETIRVLESCV